MEEQDDARNEVNRNEVNRRQVWEVLVYRTLAGLEAAVRELRKAGVTDAADIDISTLMNEFSIEATLDDRDQAAPE